MHLLQNWISINIGPCIHSLKRYDCHFRYSYVINLNYWSHDTKRNILRLIFGRGLRNSGRDTYISRSSIQFPLRSKTFHLFTNRFFYLLTCSIGLLIRSRGLLIRSLGLLIRSIGLLIRFLSLLICSSAY